jgi:hypothetical protein
VRRRALTTEVIGPLDAAAADSGQVRLLERSEHYLRYEVAAPGPVLLVASEVWYPAGWQASVDGEPVDIHRVDFLLRGVRVEPAPGGRARVVEMRFAPASVSTGRAISVGTLILSLGLLAAGWLRAGGRRRSGGVPGTPPGVGA